MDEKTDFIEFETEDGKVVPLYVLEQTRIGGVNYLLAADSDEDEAEAYIMREVADEENQAVYEMVEDETELEALSKVFSELIDDIDIEI